jgi:hypothetical protein
MCNQSPLQQPATCEILMSRQFLAMRRCAPTVVLISSAVDRYANNAHMFLNQAKNIKGVIRRIILFNKRLAKAERILLTPIKLKSDCWLKSYEHVKRSASSICPILRHRQDVCHAPFQVFLKNRKNCPILILLVAIDFSWA